MLRDKNNTSYTVGHISLQHSKNSSLHKSVMNRVLFLFYLCQAVPEFMFQTLMICPVYILPSFLLSVLSLLAFLCVACCLAAVLFTVNLHRTEH